jgi:glyoxylate reductase
LIEEGGIGKPIPPFAFGDAFAYSSPRRIWQEGRTVPEKVLIYSHFPKAQMARFGDRFELLNAAGKAPNEVFSADQLSDIRALITAGGTPLGAEAMDMMPRLGAIVCYGTGYDGIDLAAAAKREITVAHSPGANAASVADIAVTLMLAATRRLLAADDYVRSGNWAAAKPSPMMRPQPGMLGRRVGLYGMGEIGRKIATRVAAFEAEVGYFSRSQHDVPYRYFPTLDALAEWCSVLMIAVRAGAETNHAVDADILKKLGKDGYVVNISRGSVIDQPALVAALTDQTIAGAGLDVYAKEPHAPDALTALPNVVLSPHIGGHTLESHVAMQDCVIANLDAFFVGKPLPYQVRTP